MSDAPVSEKEWEVLKRFSARMNLACDRTAAHKRGVIVDIRDWHALMDLRSEVRALLNGGAA